MSLAINDSFWREFEKLLRKFPMPPGVPANSEAQSELRPSRGKTSSAEARKRSATTVGCPTENGVCSEPGISIIQSNPNVSKKVVLSDSPILGASSSSGGSTSSRRAQLMRSDTRKNFNLEDAQVLSACQGLLPADQLQKIYHGLMDLGARNELTLKNILDRAYAQLLDIRRVEMKSANAKSSRISKMFGKVESLPVVTFEKAKLSFGLTADQECPLQTAMHDRLRITCTQGRGRFCWKRPRIFKSHHFVIDPLEGVFKKGASVDISFTLLVNTTFILEEVLVLEIDGVGHHYVVVNLASEKSVFGVDPRELPHDLDNGLHVPTVLITMRQYLVSSEGLRSEGIFRLAPDEAEALTIKAQLNKSEFTRCADVNCIANLIKVWFRELPVQLLNSLPSSSFNHAETDEDCLALYQSLKEPNKTLFRWLIRLMAQTTQLEQVNKMGPRNLAIVIAPNLFTSMEEMSPLESLGLSQNVVNFVRILLDHSIKFGDLPA